MAICDKTTINKWTYERSNKSLNLYSLIEDNKIYPNTNSWKTLQEESLWQVDFENLYFWNTLNKTHQGILVWNRNSRLHTINKKHVYKGRKETTYIEVGERNIHPHIEKNKYNVCVKTVTRPNVQEQCIYKRRKEKIHNILTTSLISTTLPLTKWSYTNSPPKNNYSHIQNYFPFLSRMTMGKSVK